ncbi:MAG: hypothetical protein GY867_03780 [bacterium]|nr:hypothetical protein [bacterium]
MAHGRSVSASERRLGFETRNLPYLGDVYSSALLLTSSPQDAADLVVGTFAAAYRTWDSLRAEDLLLKDLYRAMIDLYYRDLTAPKALFCGALSGGKDNARRGGAEKNRQMSGISPDEIRNALGNLPEEIRPAAVMYFLARFSCEEVAEIVGRQRGLTKSMIRRSRKLLRESLLGGAGGGVCLGTQGN